MGDREFWIRLDPNGCCHGSVLVDYVGTVEENAHAQFTRTAASRRRENAEGWRHKRVDLEEWRRQAEPCLRGVCAHCPFDEAWTDRLKVHGGRVVHAARPSKYGVMTACAWLAGPKDKAVPNDIEVTCRQCIREMGRR